MSLITEWRVLQQSRKIVSVKSSAGYSDSWSLRHILRSIQRVTASLACHRRDAVWDDVRVDDVDAMPRHLRRRRARRVDACSRRCTRSDY